jgi:hypothetical protein
MPDPKPQMIYDELSPERSETLDYAEATAKLTLPTLAPRGEKIQERPWTCKGTSAVRALASATLKILMPPGVLWGRVDLPPEAWTELRRAESAGDAEAGLVQALRERINGRTLDNMQSLKQKNTRSRSASLLLRNLVEGNNAVQNTPMRMRVYPLRSMGCRRNEFSEVDLLLLHETLPADPVSAATKAELAKELDVWTLIDYERDEVWQQVDKEVTRLEQEDPIHYWVVVPERPDVGHYAVPYAYNYLRLMGAIDHAESSLAEAMAYCSWNPVAIREGSLLSQNPNQLMQRESGKPLVMQDGDVIWPNKQTKIGEWGFVAQIRTEDTDELAQVFAMGIKDRAMSADTSATAILEIVDELNTQTQDLLSSLEDTFQRPLLRSENRIHEAVSPLFAAGSKEAMVLGNMLRIVVTTGVNAIEKQRTMARMATQVMPAVQALDQRVIFHGEEILDRIGEGMLIDTDGLYDTMDPLEIELRKALAGQPSAFDQLGLPARGGTTRNGQSSAREETIMTAGGPQPPQPPQGPPPAGR